MTTDPSAAHNAGPPLVGVRVVAIEQAVAAPLCSRHMADLGASVIKIERPGGGDFARRYDSVVLGGSAYFVWLNRGKQSVILDLATQAGQQHLDALLAGADVLIHNLGPSAMGRLGYDESSVRNRWPRLVACQISGYGTDGPYADQKAFDLLLQGESALLSVTGTANEPAKVGISIADIAAGMYALSAILAALHGRERSNQGSWIDISMLDCLAEWMTVPALYQRYTGHPPPRSGLHHPSIAPYGPYEARDGRILIAVQNEGQWQRLCVDVLMEPSVASDHELSSNEARVDRRERVDGLIGKVVNGLTRAELIDRLTLADVPYASMNTVAELLDHPQLRERGRWTHTTTEYGDVATLVPPFGLPTVIGDVPSYGADTESVLARLPTPKVR